MKQKPISMYDSFEIGNLMIKNRLVRSATFEFGADDGVVTQRIIELYRQLAEGGSGLIITGMYAVLSSARSSPVMVETTYDGYVDDMKRIVDIVHENGSLLFVQLNHTGYKTAKSPGYDRIGVSEQEIAEGYTYLEATPDDIKRIAEAFGKAAKRCKEAGCDGVQIHGSHGYLINTFLSPYYNQRTDAYGGPIENRARILFEIYDEIRNAVDNNFPVSVKIPFSDRVSPSIMPDECVYVCRELEKRGIDMIEVTSGLTMDGGGSSFSPFVKDESQEGSFLAGAAQLANAVGIPIVSVCGYRTPDFIEKALNETAVAAVSLCRPLVREPALSNRWKSDRTKAACISCNRCFMSKGIIACQAEK
ncbi:MAG: NADH:flavin oxidoreductase [Synergistaceae bacterium]|jgi:2,4-dienoyl-CoA reductase-like NADH-dependent reductase (Old Yellow Enzyme family)|nr:NADH:flavin oxidoreductase [Synergistaceae bacterium]